MRLLLFLTSLGFLISFGTVVRAEKSPVVEIERAFGSGDAEKLLPYLGSTIDLRILETENLYGNAQAKVLLSNFFTANPLAGFVVIHRKMRSDNSFFIGTYSSRTNAYRVSIFLKIEQDKTRITQILIQNQGS